VTWTIIVAGSAACLVLLTGGLLTTIGPWYRALRKPTWQPPDWAFGPAWAIIMALVATGGALGWQAATNARQHGLLIALFLINGTLHVTWSLLFFRLRRPDWALVEVALFWVSIAALVVALWPISHRAALSLGPYLAWVSFATMLNLAIVRLNGPFRTSG
jgi:benzodiazapine receptor